MLLLSCRGPLDGRERGQGSELSRSSRQQQSFRAASAGVRCKGLRSRTLQLSPSSPTSPPVTSGGKRPEGLRLETWRAWILLLLRLLLLLLLLLLLGTRRGKNPPEHDTHVLQGLKVLAGAVNLSGAEILYRPVFGSKFGSKKKAMQDFAASFLFRSSATAKVLHF